MPASANGSTTTSTPFDLKTNDPDVLAYSLELLIAAQQNDMLSSQMSRAAQMMSGPGFTVSFIRCSDLPGLPKGALEQLKSGRLDARLIALIGHADETVAEGAATLLVNRPKDGYVAMLNALLGKLDVDEFSFEEDRIGTEIIALANGTSPARLSKRKHAYRYLLLVGRLEVANDVYTALRQKLRAEAPIEFDPLS